MIIDCHGHYTTAPAALRSFRERQLAAMRDGETLPTRDELHITDEEIRDSLAGTQLRFQQERGTDLTVFSPIAGQMGHHLGNLETSLEWAVVCNDLIHRVCTLFPDRFAAVCQLPQSPGAPPATAIPELRRCVEQLGFVGCNLNPDPAGGFWTAPPLTDRWWYPLYEVLVELDVPAMVHVSQSCNPCFHHTGAHYLNADTTAFMQFLTADLFRDFPTLRVVIPHGGGAVPYHWGRYRGLAQDLKRPELEEHLLHNVFFDTCVYHAPGIELLTKVVPIDNILFASEMIGAVRGIDPRTGHHYDDTKRYVDQVQGLSGQDRWKLFEGNVRRVYPRLDAQLTARGLPNRLEGAR
jgi:4-oxalmesaconate hydratase